MSKIIFVWKVCDMRIARFQDTDKFKCVNGMFGKVGDTWVLNPAHYYIRGIEGFGGLSGNDVVSFNEFVIAVIDNKPCYMKKATASV